MSAYEKVVAQLRHSPRKWVVTGVAGFIGSHLLEALLKFDQTVVGVDSFATGTQVNLDAVRQAVGVGQWERFRFQRGDIANLEVCRETIGGADFVLHQAALGSVPRSIAEPLLTHQTNVTGFLNVLIAGRDAGIQRLVFASSSAVYGDNPDLPKVEQTIGQPLSPYAASKVMNELYATAFASVYKCSCIGLRYFNVFGPRQDPRGPYAAVIPQWIGARLAGKPPEIHGDGQTSRDFCFVEDVVQANVLAAIAAPTDAHFQIYNVASGRRTTLTELLALIDESLRRRGAADHQLAPVYSDFRSGDVRHSLADINRAQGRLGYQVSLPLPEAIERTLDWYASKPGASS